LFQSIVHHQWSDLLFSSGSVNKWSKIDPYKYKMIRSLDFYRHTDKILSTENTITTLYGNIENISQMSDHAQLCCDGMVYTADYIFSSIPRHQEKKPKKYQYMLQHFEGWIIEANTDLFDPDRATLMDFHTGQEEGTTFVYVLPLSKNKALVEYTLFSEELLPKEKYGVELKRYIEEQLKCSNYQILERETGVIPMSDHPITANDGRIIHLGTAGGSTKASTGYTFQFIQNHTAAIVKQLVNTGYPSTRSLFSKRFELYDGTLLYLLNKGRLQGEEIFSRLFQKNDMRVILKFLSNETSLTEEIGIFYTLQKTSFLVAFFRRLLG